MIEFITPKMYGLDDTLTKPGFGADAKAVGDALAAIEVGGGGGAAPDLTGYATEEYVDNAIAAIPKTDLSEYAKTEDVPSIEGLATETYVDDAIAQAQLSGGDIDLSEYAKKSDIPDTSGFIKEIPGEYITETELNDKGYLTEHQDLSDYALKTDILPFPDLSDYALKSEIPVVPDVSAYQTEEQVIALIEANMPASAEEVEY